MKKFILMLFAAIFSIGLAVADGNMCQVPGGGQVYLTKSSANYSKNSYYCPGGELKNDSDRDVTVLVMCYDAVTDEFLGSKSVTVGAKNSTTFSICPKPAPKGSTVYFKIKLC